MHNAILSFIFICVSVKCFCQSKWAYNDLFFDNLRGRVEKVTENPYTVDIRGRILQKDSCCRNILGYDKKGFRIMEIIEDSSGKMVSGQFYTHRYSDGKVKEIQFISNGSIVSILSGVLKNDGSYGVAMIYDTARNLLSFYSDVEENKYGKIISMRSFRPDSTLQQTVINNYSEQIWVGGAVLDSVGKELFSTHIILDNKRNPSEVIQKQTENGKLIVNRIKYKYLKYDMQGNWVRRLEINNSEKTQKVIIRHILYYRN